MGGLHSLRVTHAQSYEGRQRVKPVAMQRAPRIRDPSHPPVQNVGTVAEVDGGEQARGDGP
jgi:hypothetical protein